MTRIRLQIWKSTTDGQYSFKSTYDEVREHRQGSALYSVIWNQNIPKKMSFVAWRLLNGWLPVDEMMIMKADWITKNSWKKGEKFIWEADTKDIGMKRLIQLEISGLPQIRLGIH
ncbi:hypothetical protein LIER_38230 [Lithospermum erythrorhizon]|uniref:Reverse transcriptase zinc-binding domain-containing protein n=1 Tax=Lithospermum erythrorhizon TaxID=34254 RepID=A0AAV3Q0P2_LITER